MHAYATNASDRDTTPLYIGFLAVASALALGSALDYFHLTVPWWIDAPSVMGFYGIYRSLFDTNVWSRTLFRRWRFSSIPDIRGTWVGYARSSHNEGTYHPVLLYIHQTWTKISVILETTSSRSSSTMASLNTRESQEAGLKYEYLNEPRAHEVVTMNSHRGNAHLRLSPDGKRLEGDYFTGRGRQNIGSLCFIFLSHNEVNHDDALVKAKEYIQNITAPGA